jgi:hypothetical protein
MFNNPNQKKTEPVKLVLADGRVVSGTLMLPVTSEVRRALGGDGAVVEFLHENGDFSLVAKSQIIEIILLNESQRTEAVAA